MNMVYPEVYRAAIEERGELDGHYYIYHEQIIINFEAVIPTIRSGTHTTADRGDNSIRYPIGRSKGSKM